MPVASTISHSLFSDVPKVFSRLLSAVVCKRFFASRSPRGTGRPKLSPWQWIMARVYHEFARSSTFSANVKTITRVTIFNTALSQHAFSIDWKLNDEILTNLLRILADMASHPVAFHRGYRDRPRGPDPEAVPMPAECDRRSSSARRHVERRHHLDAPRTNCSRTGLQEGDRGGRSHARRSHFPSRSSVPCRR